MNLDSIFEMPPRKRRVLIKKEARKTLYNDWVMRILAFVITGACSIGIMQFGVSLSLVLEGITQNVKLSLLFYLVYILLSIVLVVPLFYGLVYAFVFSDTQNGKIKLGDLFYAFSEVDILMRSYRLFLYTLIKLLVCFLPALLLNFFVETYYYQGLLFVESTLYGFDLVYFALKSIVMVFAFFGFVLSVKNILGIYVSVKREDKQISECFFVSRILCDGAKGELAMCAVSFFPLMLLSLFTFGFLFVMYTLPYMLITFIIYSKYLYDNEMITLKTKNILYENADKNIKYEE